MFSRRLAITRCIVAVSALAIAEWGDRAAASIEAANTAASITPLTSRPMSELRVTATIPVGKTTDWVRVTRKSVWVGSKNPFAVSEIDPQTNHVINTVTLPGDPCAGIAADGEDLWVPLCGPIAKLAKIDLKTRMLSAVFDVGPAAKEGGIAVGAGSVWMVIDKAGALARINPVDGAVVGVVQVPPGSYNPVFADGRIWVTRADGAELTVVDAKSARILNHIPVGPNPRFATAGGGGVWTLNQGDGSLSRVDIAGRRPVKTLQLQTPGAGGDIAYGAGEIWTTMVRTPLTAIDAGRSVILCQWKGDGGDAIGVGHGAIWLTDLSAGTVLRIALRDLPKECRVESRGG